MTENTRAKAEKEKYVGHDVERSPSEDLQLQGANSYADMLTLQRVAGNQSVNSIFQIGGGQPLDQATRNEMQNRFGTDFGDVQVHTDHEADESALNLNAQAYTVGSHVVFRSHRYQPSTPSGRSLLAHELSHVIQQRGNLGTAGPAHESISEEIESQINSPTLGEVGDLSSLASKAGTASVQVQAKPENANAQPRRPDLTPEIEQEMTEDVEALVIKLRNFDLSFSDQQVIVSKIEKYVQADKEYSTFSRYKGSAYLDPFLIKLKMKVFKRSSFRSMWVDQSVSAYDALWDGLTGVWLEKFKGAVVHSQNQGTKGPELTPLENPWATISRQEAIGLWGVLKGMGTGLVGVASPIAATKIGESFDESGKILFGKEWTEGEDLDFGHGIHLNARQIGTAGGNVIIQLALLGKGKTSTSFAKAQKILGIASNLQGVGVAANQIADLVARMQQNNTLSLENLVTNPEFLGQSAALISNIYGAMTGASTNGDQALQARIQLLLQGAQVLPEFGKIIEIQNSAKTTEVKHRETGEIIVNLIGQIVGILISTAQYQQQHAKGTSSDLHPEIHPQIPEATEHLVSGLNTENTAPETRAVPHNEFEPEIDLTKESGLELGHAESMASPSPHTEFEQQNQLTAEEMEARMNKNAPESERAVGSPGTARHGESESRTGENYRLFNAAEVALGLRTDFSPEHGGYVRSVEFSVPDVVGNFGTRPKRFSTDAMLNDINVEHMTHGTLTGTQTERGHPVAQQLSGGDPDVAAALMTTSNIWPMRGRGSTGVNQGVYKQFEDNYISLKSANPNAEVHVRVEAVVGTTPDFITNARGQRALVPEAFDITITLTPPTGKAQVRTMRIQNQ